MEARTKRTDVFHSAEVAMETRHTLSLIGPHLRPGDRLLDVGTGAGYVPWLAEQEYDVRATGVDIADYRRAPLPSFAVFDGIHLPFPDDSFDVLVLAFVLHHLPNDRKGLLLAEAKRVAARTLIVVEDTPRNAVDRWFSRRHGEEFRRRINSTAPFGFFTQAQWAAVLEVVGFRLVESRRLSRFCRAWDAPFARSAFVLAKPQAMASDGGLGRVHEGDIVAGPRGS